MSRHVLSVTRQFVENTQCAAFIIDGFRAQSMTYCRICGLQLLLQQKSFDFQLICSLVLPCSLVNFREVFRQHPSGKAAEIIPLPPWIDLDSDADQPIEHSAR